VKTDDPYGAERVNRKSSNSSAPHTPTWIDMNRQFFEAVRLERTVMFFLLFFIVMWRLLES